MKSLLWSARTRPRFESGDMSSHSKKDRSDDEHRSDFKIGLLVESRFQRSSRLKNPWGSAPG
jgi:hypothetical protein